MSYFAPSRLADALDCLAQEEACVIAGGTDVYPAGQIAAYGSVLDLSGIAEMQGISRSAAGWRIGAQVTWRDIWAAELPPAFHGLQQAAREVGAVQIQNAATVVGNLCNASPAADGVPVLLTLEAEVEIAGPDGARRLPLAEFITGVRQTVLGPGELVVALHIPAPPENARSHFAKLGARRYLVISIAMVSVVMRVDGGRIGDLRVAVGACSPVAQRLHDLECDLNGRPVADLPHTGFVTEHHLAGLSPIGDMRASAAYRLSAARELVERSVFALAGGEAARG